MLEVRVFGDDELTPLFTAELPFMPRIGEYISKDAGGYFRYYHVVEVWQAEDLEKTGVFHACVRVEEKD
jgi:hypothetical protein